MNNSTNATGAPAMRFPPKSLQCSRPTEEAFYFHTAFLVFILVLTLVGNLMVVLAVVLFHRMRTITNYFVVSLAMADLMVSVLSLPFRLDQTVHNAAWCLSLEACVTWIVCDVIASGASIWNLAMISIDRFIAIVLPFRYHVLMTQRTGFSLMATAWLLSFVMAMLSLVNFGNVGGPLESHFNIDFQCAKADKYYYTVVSVTGFFLPLLIVIFMYGNVFHVALNQARAVAALQTDSSKRGRRSSINFVKEVKAAKILAIVIGCFVLCWFPFFVLTLISLYDLDILRAMHPTTNKVITIIFVYVLPALNSTMNPIIYTLFNKEFRFAFRKIFQRLRGRALGAIGLDDTSMSMSMTNDTRSTTANAPKTRNHKMIRFKDTDSNSSEQSIVPPTIPLRDPNAFYNEGFAANNSDPKSSSDQVEFKSNGSAAREVRTETRDESPMPDTTSNVKSSDISDDTDNAKLNTTKIVKLPPLPRDSMSEAGDDVDTRGPGHELGNGDIKSFRPHALPPIERKPDRSISDNGEKENNNIATTGELPGTPTTETRLTRNNAGISENSV